MAALCPSPDPNFGRFGDFAENGANYAEGGLRRRVSHHTRAANKLNPATNGASCQIGDGALDLGVGTGRRGSAVIDGAFPLSAGSLLAGSLLAGSLLAEGSSDGVLLAESAGTGSGSGPNNASIGAASGSGSTTGRGRDRRGS